MSKYKVILKANGEELVGEADTVDKAVLKTKPKTTIKTYGYIQLFEGKKKSAELKLSVFKGKRLFIHPLFRMITCRNLKRSLI